MHDRYELFHQITSVLDIDQDIEHDGGRACIINGDVFYSPNSTASVGLPPPVESNPTIWRNSRTSFVREFHQPLWWSVETAYLAFLPIYPQFCGEPFGELLDLPNCFDYMKEGYILDPQVLLKWKKLEFFLKRVVQLLLVKSLAPAPEPIIDTAISCTGFYREARYFRRAVGRTRDWFSLWMAQVSYTIALAMSAEQDSLPDTAPNWCHFLLRREFAQAGWDQTYIFGVRQSMGNFSPSVLRSGIFLQIASPPRHQFSVDWFLKFHVPVWYPWGQREVDVARTSRQVGRLAPPSEKLQALATFMSKEPESHVEDNNDQPARAAQSKQDVVQKPWAAFLAERAARTKEIIACETPQDRQKRENRERIPPKHRTKVYVWEKDDKSKNGYCRNLVTQRNNEYTLSDYSDAQRVYNSVFNEWDCCEELGEEKPDSDSDDGDDFFEDHNENLVNNHHFATSVAHATSTTSPLRIDSPMPPPFATSSEGARPTTPARPTTHSSNPTGHTSVNEHVVAPPSRAEADYQVDSYDAVELLRDFLGFVPPLPFPTSTDPRDRLSGGKLKTLLSLVGLQEQRPDCSSAMIPTDIWNFLEAFNSSNSQLARTPLWDLAIGNRLYLRGCMRLHCLRSLQGEKIGETQEKLYYFDFGQNATVPWHLAVTNIIDALFVCRLPRRWNDYRVVQHLLTRGIRFRTLLPHTLPPPRDLPITLIPFRLSGYVFTSRDYDIYLREREALLRNPRIARAALMKGGIIWRLIVASTSPDDILSGPSAAISLHNLGLALGESNNGHHLWDDIVSNEELDQICGTYLCYTGELSSDIFLDNN
jgi:hypothetical protein